MYSYIKDNKVNNNPTKGIGKVVKKKDIKLKYYKNRLFNNKQICHNIKTR